MAMCHHVFLCDGHLWVWGVMGMNPLRSHWSVTVLWAKSSHDDDTVFSRHSWRRWSLRVA